METSKLGLNQYLDAVAGKLADEGTTHMLQFGTQAHIEGQGMIRDNEGLLSTKANILESAQMLFAMTEGRDAFAVKMANFSVGNNAPSTGYEAVADVHTIGAIDMTIISKGQSLIPFAAVDRAMKNDIDTVFYEDLVALNNAGGVNAGDPVDSNFGLTNSKVNISAGKKAIVAGSESKIQAGVELVPRSVKVTCYFSDDTNKVAPFYGQDFAGDGMIMFPPKAKNASGSMVATGVTSATVDYDAGTIEVTGTGFTWTADYAMDVNAQANGNATLKVGSVRKSVQLVSTQDNIIVKDNLANRLNMQKVQLLATNGVGGTSPADILFARTKNVYIDAMNRKVLDPIVDAVAAPAINYDMSSYALDTWNSTKNDQVVQLMANTEALFLAQTGMEPTAILTGTFGVSLLQCIPFMWTKNPESAKGHDGLAGYFDGKAVYRHHYLNLVAKKAKKSGENQVPVQYFFVAKTPDNNCGSVVFGEYLPLTSSGVCSNYENPVNISTGFFSMTGAKLILGKLVMMAQIVPPTNTFGAAGAGIETV